MSWLGETLTTVAMLIGLDSAGPVAHGYVEGEYLRIAAPVAGFLEERPVVRGQTVAKGAPLFAIDRQAAVAERDRLAGLLAQTRAQLADLATGKRPEELAVIEAQRDQAEAALRKARADLERQQELVRRANSTDEKLDSARSAYEQATARVAELKAQLATARLPARADQIRAAEAAVAAAAAALAQQDRRLADMAPLAPTGARVEDTLYNPGEWVPAGSTVVSLLPPEAIKLVTFVPETYVAGLSPGAVRRVRCDGCSARLTARVASIASKTEYTPPVIYSVGSREKLVVRVEFVPDTADGLPPGLPVDVELTP